MVLEKILESSLESKEIKPVNPKVNQPRIFIGRIETDAPIRDHLMGRADSLETALMLGNIEGGRRKGQQNRMVRWHHQLNGCEFEQIMEDSEDVEAWNAAVHGVTNDQIQLNKRTRSFTMSYLMLKSLSHFEFTFVHDMSVCSNVIDLHAEA